MQFFFVVDPEESKVFPKVDIPIELGPDYISALGVKITEQDIRNHDASFITFDPSSDDMLVLDGKVGDVLAYFIKIPVFSDIIVVMPKITYADEGARAMFTYDSDSHFLNALAKLAPSVRLSAASDMRTLSIRGVNVVPARDYTVDKIYALMGLTDDIDVEVFNLSTGMKTVSSTNVNLSQSGMYVVTVGPGEVFFPVTGSKIPTGFKYIVCAE